MRNIKYTSSKFVKLILKILAINIIFMMYISNKSLAYDEKWDDFYVRFVGATEENGNINDLSDEDIYRMVKGPTIEEKGSNSLVDQDALRGPQANARTIQSNRETAGTWGLDDEGNRIKETNDNEQKDNTTNSERRKQAQKLKLEIQQFDTNTNYNTYDDIEELKKYREKIKQYLDYGNISSATNPTEYKNMLDISNKIEDRIEALGGERDNSLIDDQVGTNGQTSGEIHGEQEDPMKGHLGNSDPEASHTVDEIMNEADGFLNTGKGETVPINGENVRVGSGILYNILLAIAVVAAVVIGLYLGIKFMMSSAEDRAKVKEALIPYIAGCVVIFASFTIWKLVISILGNVA